MCIHNIGFGTTEYSSPNDCHRLSYTNSRQPLYLRDTISHVCIACNENDVMYLITIIRAKKSECWRHRRIKNRLSQDVWIPWISISFPNEVKLSYLMDSLIADPITNMTPGIKMSNLSCDKCVFVNRPLNSLLVVFSSVETE